MIRLLDNFDLTQYNTFAIRALSKRFFEFTEIEDLLSFLAVEKLPEKHLVLGGGSNFLFKNDYDGLVIYPNIPGVVQENEDRNHVYIEAGAGVELDELVRLSVVYGFGGLENLSHIPGRVGAAPVQNVGAYGVEVKDCIYKVKAIDIITAKQIELTNAECNFSYRNSIFKSNLKNKVIVTSVVFKLDKFPEYNLEYGALKNEVERLGDINLNNVRQAVINIRESKLPNPKLLGNAGSFFKNPIVNAEIANGLCEKYHKMPVYPVYNSDKVKLAAGWLIDQCGLKGYRKGNVGVHNEQALILVNYGGATGAELVVFSQEIQHTVNEKFNIILEPEVSIV